MNGEVGNLFVSAVNSRTGEVWATCVYVQIVVAVPPVVQLIGLSTSLRELPRWWDTACAANSLWLISYMQLLVQLNSNCALYMYGKFA